MSKASGKRTTERRLATFRLVLLVGILILLNLIIFRFSGGIDFTTDRRYTLSATTKNMLRNMDDVASIKIYLKGKLPSGIQKLAQSTEEQLNAFRKVAGNNIVYTFEDPFKDATSVADQKEVYNFMAAKGINPLNLQRQDIEEGFREQIIFPYALVQYKGGEMAVPLLENYMGKTAQENLNNSENLLEYKLANAINQLQSTSKPRIAYVIGNGEMFGAETEDMLITASQYFTLDTIDITTGIAIPTDYKAIIINRPTVPFKDREKFKIDQYVMRGGNVLWAIDPVDAPMDSLFGDRQAFTTISYDLNLEDQLFKYGVRVNNNLIEDLNCNPIPITAGMRGNQPNVELRPWIYFGVFEPGSQHPIVKNMDGVMSMFASSLDTIATPDIKKTILLSSSEYSRAMPTPARISLSILAFKPKIDLFNKPNQPVAVLLEGQFKSAFTGRLTDTFMTILKDTFKTPFLAEAQKEGKQIVIGDGDIFGNDYSEARGGAFEMGYWRYTNNRFSNKTFFLNCLEYLTNPNNLLEARAKDRKLRLLDLKRIQREKTYWSTLNIVFPVAFVMVFASVYFFIRKRKYGTPIQNKVDKK